MEYYNLDNLSKCIPGLTIQNELRWPVLTACLNDECDYIAKIIYRHADIESKIYQILKDSDITPKLIDFKPCSIYDNINNKYEHVNVMITEKYDGTLYELFKQNLNINDIKNILNIVLKKSIELNFIYQIRQGDFHSENIVYKQDDILKIGFIDFEFSIIYNNTVPILYTTEDNLNMLQYNPYHDILTLEYAGVPNYRLKFNVPLTYRDLYLSNLNEADLEIMNETIEGMKDYPLLEFDILQ